MFGKYYHIKHFCTICKFEDKRGVDLCVLANPTHNRSLKPILRGTIFSKKDGLQDRAVHNPAYETCRAIAFGNNQVFLTFVFRILSRPYRDPDITFPGLSAMVMDWPIENICNIKWLGFCSLVLSAILASLADRWKRSRYFVFNHRCQTSGVCWCPWSDTSRADGFSRSNLH
jgi:hypothetical protein